MPINVITGRSISSDNATFSEYHNGYIRIDQSLRLYYTNSDGEEVFGRVHESALALSDNFIVGGQTMLASEASEIPNLALGLRLFYKADTARNYAYLPSGSTPPESLPTDITLPCQSTDISGQVIGEDGRGYRFIHVPVFNEAGEAEIAITPFLAYTGYRTRYINIDGVNYFTSRNVFNQLKANASTIVYNNTIYLSIEDAIRNGAVPDTCANSYHASQYDSAFGNINRDKLNDENIKFRVGFEIEKVDKVAKYRLSTMGFKKTLPSGSRIIIEQDSSLSGVDANYGGGFEAVTTIYDLFGEDIINDCNHVYFKTLLDASATSINSRGTNGDTNFEAGGHVNISALGMSTEQLNDALEPFAGLLYGLHARNLRRYANFQNKDRFKRGRVYSGAAPAFENKYNGLMEIRLFGPVSSVEGFKVRVELLRAICELIGTGNVKSYIDVNQILRDPNTRLSMAAAAELKEVEAMFAEALGEATTPDSEIAEVVRKRAMLFAAAMDAQNFGLSKAKFGVFADRAQKQLANVYDALHDITKSRLHENEVRRETIFS